MIPKLLKFFTWRLVPAPSVLSTNEILRKSQPRTRHPPKFRWSAYTPTAWPFRKQLPEIKQSAYEKVLRYGFHWNLAYPWIQRQWICHAWLFAYEKGFLRRSGHLSTKRTPIPIYRLRIRSTAYNRYILVTASIRDTRMRFWLVLFTDRLPVTSRKDGELLKSIKDFHLSHLCSHLLLLGDINTPDIIWNEGVPARGYSSRLLRLVQEEDWTQLVWEPSRYRTGQQPSPPDLVFTDESHLIDKKQISESVEKSDHAVSEFNYHCYWTFKFVSTKLLRNFSKADFTGLASHLVKTIHTNGSVYKLFIGMKPDIHEADLKCIPRKSVKKQSAPFLLHWFRLLVDSRTYFSLSSNYCNPLKTSLPIEKSATHAETKPELCRRVSKLV